MRILKLKCLDVIANNQKIKSFNEKLLESYWNCITNDLVDGEDLTVLKDVFKKLNEINQRWLLGKLIENLKKEEFSIIKYLTDIKLKVCKLSLQKDHLCSNDSF